MSDPVQVSQICDGKWPAGEIWTGSDTIRASQICDGKWPAVGGFSVTNLEIWTGSDTIKVSQICDRITHDQGWLPGGGRDFPSQIWETWTGSDTIKAGWLRGIFRDEFGKSGQDQTRSGLAG